MNMYRNTLARQVIQLYKSIAQLHHYLYSELIKARKAF